MRFMNWSTVDGWFSMGWDDYAATYNAITHSKTAVAMRVNRWVRELEDHLKSSILKENAYYAIGVEDAMLRGFDIKGEIPRANQCMDAKLYSPALCCPCGFCGRPVENGYLTTFGLIVDTVFCTEECIKNRLETVIHADMSLHELYYIHRRKASPIPEDGDAMRDHFEAVPRVNILTDMTPPKRVKSRFPKSAAHSIGNT